MLQFRDRKYLFRFQNVIAAFFFFLSTVVFSQSPFKYIWPIDSPFVMTANYGELRPNHFHAGIDFSTRGVINLPVYCIEEGYVSRIRVSPYGYGKCVYITHPNGKVSVYAHLNAYSLKIASKAKEHQYITQNYEIDFMPKPRSLYVRKNEIIGLSGNTGGSTGPHLHFEIRDEITETPLNPLGFYRLSDPTPPELHAIALYNLADTTVPKLMHTYKIKGGRNDSLVLEEDHITLDQSIVGLAFSGLDRYLSNGNPNNIFAARIYMDDTLIYMHELNNIGFSETRFINEYSGNIGKMKYQKCFQPTIYPPGFYGKCRDKGKILLNENKFHKIKLVVTDEAGNTTRLQFYLKAKQINEYKKVETNGDVFVTCTESFTFNKDNLLIKIPAKTLFYSTALFINTTLENDGKLSIKPDVNLNQPATIGFSVPPQLWPNREKILLRGSSTSYPVNRDDSVFFEVKEFGNFHLTLDTISPKIKVNYSEKKLKDAWQMDSFSFQITDNSSGIGKYNLWLNNSWVLAEYEPKTDLLTYYFDDDTPIGLLQFKLEVVDKVGNKTFLEYVLKK